MEAKEEEGVGSGGGWRSLRLDAGRGVVDGAGRLEDMVGGRARFTVRMRGPEDGGVFAGEETWGCRALASKGAVLVPAAALEP